MKKVKNVLLLKNKAIPPKKSCTTEKKIETTTELKIERRF